VKQNNADAAVFVSLSKRFSHRAEDAAFLPLALRMLSGL
jgi:hypothetical protein